jgi:hypothetical protein
MNDFMKDLDDVIEVEPEKKKDWSIRYDYAIEVFKDGRALYSSKNFGLLKDELEKAKNECSEGVFICFERKLVPIKKFSFGGEDVRYAPEYLKMIHPSKIKSLLEESATLIDE